MKKLTLLLIAYVFLIILEPDSKSIALKTLSQKFLQTICKMQFARKKIMRICKDKEVRGDKNGLPFNR